MPRILVVEDSESYAEYTRAVLMGGHEVMLARNGREAMNAVRQADFDLIITDIFMPELDGFELMRMMRQDAPGVPIIAMSSADHRRPDFLRIAAKLGATGTLAKPWQPRELIRAVTAALSLRNPANRRTSP